MCLTYKKKVKMIIGIVCFVLGLFVGVFGGVDESVVQLSEECAELIQAAMKFRRAMTGATPVPLAKAQSNLIEEMADVRVCIDEMIMLLDTEFSHDTEKQVTAQQKAKTERWYKRLGL